MNRAQFRRRNRWLRVALAMMTLSIAFSAHGGVVDLAYSGKSLLARLGSALNPPVTAASSTFHLDIDLLDWDGEPVSLDARSLVATPSAARNAEQLEWRIKEPAYGSSYQAGQLLGKGETIRFSADRAGVWRISVGAGPGLEPKEIRIRLYRMGRRHPRIYLTPDRLATLRARARMNTPAWRKLERLALKKNGEMLSEGLYSVVAEKPEYCRDAVSLALKKMGRKKLGNSKAGDIATVYDWCATTLSAGERKRFIKYFNDWGDRYLAKTRALRGVKPDNPGLGNYWPRFSYSFGLIALATYGDNPRAREWLDYFRFVRWPVESGFLDLIAKGGGWPEGIVYDAISNFSRMRLADAWRNATGEDLFSSSAWFQERFGTLMMQHLPGLFVGNNNNIHPYTSFGDYERNRVTMDSYWRIAALILVDRYPEDPIGRQLRSYLAAPKTAAVHKFIQWAEFLWFDPARPGTPPTLKSHYDPSLGNVFLRSGWPDGSDDLDRRVTVLNYRCGDFFAYHQHLDQNSFTLYRSAPLLLDSGVYSGNGTSNHDANYYIRTIAHNTLVVYNKDEDFRRVRYNAYANDGGQRAVYPATRAPRSVEQYLRDHKYYDTCDMMHFVDDGEVAYLAGDATRAYNSIYYSQSQDTGLKNNVPKVKLFQRELVYLRAQPGRDGNDYVVLHDRVAVTRPEFSGSNTKLLFHFQEKPEVAGVGRRVSSGEMRFPNAVAVTEVNGPGRLVLYSLLPRQHNLRIVGGKGKKAYWVFGKNYNWHWKGDEGNPDGISTNFEKDAYGKWRLEIEPSDRRLSHDFLTVLFPSEASAKNMPEVSVIEAGRFEGARMSDSHGIQSVLFPRQLKSGSERTVIEYELDREGRKLRGIIVGLTPGSRYRLDEFGGETAKIRLSPSQNGEFVVNQEGVLKYSMGEG